MEEIAASEGLMMGWIGVQVASHAMCWRSWRYVDNSSAEGERWANHQQGRRGCETQEWGSVKAYLIVTESNTFSLLSLGLKKQGHETD